MATPGSEKEKKALEESESPADYPNFILAFVLAGTAAFVAKEELDVWWQTVVIGVGSFVVMVFFLCPLVILLLSMLVAAVGLVVDSLILEPMARVLELSAVDKWIKAAAFLVFVVGFHFDLLSS